MPPFCLLTVTHRFYHTFGAGTTDRIMLITGKPEEVIAAQYLVWDNVSLHASEDGFGAFLISFHALSFRPM